MFRRTLLALPFLTSALIGACGSRTSLTLAGAGEGGGAATSSGPSSGGASSGGASSTSTSSSDGGSGGACDTLLLSGEPITSPPSRHEHGRRPKLAPAAEDGSLVSVVLARELVDGPSPSPSRMVHAEIAPWDEWPESLGEEYKLCDACGETFAVGSAMPPVQPAIAVLFGLPSSPYPSDMYLAYAVEAGVSYDTYPGLQIWEAPDLSLALSVARGDWAHLAAYTLPVEGSSSTYVHLALVDSVSPVVTTFGPVACAEAPFPAEVAPIAGGFLIAAAAGQPFGGCQDDGLPPGPANALHVIRFDVTTKEQTLSAAFEEADPIAHVALARGAGGAWLVWQANGQSALQPPPVQAARLDATGGVAGPVFQVTHDGETQGPLAAAALGSRLAVAWAGSVSTLRLDLFDEGGAKVAEASLDLGPAALDGESLSLLASPDGAHLLLAWSDIPAGEAATARVARFSCAGAP